MGAIVKGENLLKVYGFGENEVVAIDHLDIRIEEGEYAAITGTSGSGKSTLLHMIGGLDSLTGGELQVFGKNMDMEDQELTAFRRKNIGFIFQQFYLFPQLTVYQNIVIPAMINKNAGYEQRATEIMEYLGILNRRNSLAGSLSGGQQQKTAIARALITGANLILADEPTGNLDSISAGKVKDLLERIRDDFGKTLIVVTHDLAYADRAERRIEMSDGRIRI